jgi:hypothetical protein
MEIKVVYTLFLRFDLSEIPAESREYIRDKLKFMVDDKEVDPGYDDDKKKPPYRKESNTLSLTYRSTGDVFFFNPDLSRLPFDKPAIKLKFELSAIEEKETNSIYRFNCLVTKPFLGNNGQITFRENCDRVPEYNFAMKETSIERPPVIKKFTDDKKQSIEYVHYPITMVGIQCYREPEYLIFSIVVPLLLINLFTLTIFFMDSTDLGTKLGILVTILLALFAFTFSVRQSLPSVPYLTDLEKQIVISIMILFIALMETIIGYVSNEDIGFVTKIVSAILAIILVLGTLVQFLVQYALYRRECNSYDDENKDFLDKKAKIKEEGPFSFAGCIARGKHLTSQSQELIG